MAPANPLKPGKLKPGDTVCLVAPASATIDWAPFQRGKRLLEERGFRVIEGKHIRETRLLFAGEDAARGDDINRAFADDSVDAVMCVRGGAGTARILPHIDFAVIQQNPKIFIGYSDITALQLAILARCGLVTFYGPMLATDLGGSFTRFTEQSLLETLTTTDERIEMRKRPGKKILTLCPGEAYGQLVGGCLSIIVATLGTKWEVDTHDKILFFEDIDEFPHRIDRYLTQLLLANKLQKASAILFGALSRCEYPPRHEYAGLRVSTLDIIREQVVPLGKPCLYGLPFGHTRDKLTMPNGGYAFVDATNQRVLLDPAVS
jgi:muramoyltetrapeptide carboxypeptidase